jgi:hypothetical protein
LFLQQLLLLPQHKCRVRGSGAQFGHRSLHAPPKQLAFSFAVLQSFGLAKSKMNKT